MGVYKFRWNQPAKKVVVTGSFDDWSQSESLDKVDDGFEKAVHINNDSDKIFYKFVVDDTWTTDPSAPQELDNEGNQNNVLKPDDIMADDKATTPGDAAAAAIQNNVTPDSSTAQLAGAQPTTSSKKNKKKKKKAKAAAAGADDSAAADEPAVEKKDESAEDKPTETPTEVKNEPTEEVSATPATAEASEAKRDKEAAPTPTGVPGGFPDTPALAAETEKEASVSPMPAANGAVNPVKLEPGEEVPKATTEDVNKNVKLDKESYEKSDALPAEETKDKPVSVDPLPAATGAVNPVKLEPGQEVPKATTEDINKNVKLDKESYEKSDALPQSESLPPASNNTIPESSLPVTGAAEAAFINSAGPESTTAKLAGQVPLEPKAEKTLEAKPEEKPAAAVPEPVKGSLEQSGKAPEAAASDEKVQEKKDVEKEVMENVETKPAETDTAAAVPEPVKASVEESGEKPEAAANATAVGEKKEVEEELKKVVEAKPEAKTEAGPAKEEGKAAEAAPAKAEEAKPAEAKKEEPKPSEGAAKTEEAKPAAAAKPAEKPAEAKPAEAAKPAEKPAEAKPTEAAKPAEGAAATNGAKADGAPAKKKKNRISSLFTKLKSKFSE